jgi:predicted NBD/HSP70 family sugar kinase
MAFDPQLVVLGGGVTQAGELPLNAVHLTNTAHLSDQIQEIGE